MQYFPGEKVVSIIPDALMRLSRARALISIVYRKCGRRSLLIGCIALSCLLAAIMYGSAQQCVLSLQRKKVPKFKFHDHGFEFVPMNDK